MAKTVFLYLQDNNVKEKIVDAIAGEHIVILQEPTDIYDHAVSEKDVVIFHKESVAEDLNTLVEYCINDIKDLRLLVLTYKPSVIEGTRLLQKGVKGYGNVYMGSQLLKQAVDIISSGNVWLYPELSSFIISQATVHSDIQSKIKHLNERDQEIVLLVCKGLSNKKIASIIDLSEISIKKALTKIYQTLDVHDRLEMISLLK